MSKNTTANEIKIGAIVRKKLGVEDKTNGDLEEMRKVTEEEIEFINKAAHKSFVNTMLAAARINR